MVDRGKREQARVRLRSRNSSPVQLYVPKRLHEELAGAADELGLTKNALMTIILLSFLEQYEEHISFVFANMNPPEDLNDSRLQVNLPEIIKAQLAAIAKQQKRTMNWLANLALNTFVDNYIKSGTKIVYDILDIKYR